MEWVDLLWRNYGTIPKIMELASTTGQKLWFYGKKTMVLYRKLWNFALLCEKSITLWKNLLFYTETMEL